MAVRVSQAALTPLFTNPGSNARVSQVTVTTLISLAPPPVPPPAASAQIAFGGVRRLPRMEPIPDFSQFDLRTFTYQMQGQLTLSAPVNGIPLTLRKTIVDYDFLLYQVMFFYRATAVLPSTVCSFLLYDQAHNQISNIPMLDVFLNGAPGSPYENGALVPPLRYKQNTQIRLDLFNLTSIAPITATIVLVGRQLIPKGQP